MKCKAFVGDAAGAQGAPEDPEGPLCEGSWTQRSNLLDRVQEQSSQWSSTILNPLRLGRSVEALGFP